MTFVVCSFIYFMRKKIRSNISDIFLFFSFSNSFQTGIVGERVIKKK